MNMKQWFPVVVVTIALSLVAITFLDCRYTENVEDCKQLQKIPQIKPDYTGIIIPPNMAPMNFVI